MDKLRRLFGEYEITWKRLIIFSVICGVYTAAVLLIPYVNETALKEIGVGYEYWFIFAIFIVSNCKSAKEAAIKCFVFFLISQPLVYLIQMPFSDVNLLQRYYMPWFIKTILTLPGAVIAYQIKRNDLLGSLVLSFAGTYLTVCGAAFFLQGIETAKISYLIYAVALVVATVILGMIFCKQKKHFIVFIVVVLIASIIIGCMFIRTSLSEKTYEMPLTDEGWYLAGCSFNNMNADIEGDVLVITYYKNSSKGEITLMNDNDEEIHLSAHVEKGEVVIEEN